MNTLYSTLTVGRDVKDFPKWQDMLNRHAHQNLFSDDKNPVTPGKTWGDVCKDCAGKDLMETLDYVNKLWNKKRYVKDKTNFKKEDYWQTPYQFAHVGGDCEDYAIAKMLSLKELGITNDMRMLLVERNGQSHAVLAVDDGDKTWLLDNATNVIREHSNYKCKLRASLGDGGIFSHIYPANTAIA